jgi:hypothetical protein
MPTRRKSTFYLCMVYCMTLSQTIYHRTAGRTVIPARICHVDRWKPTDVSEKHVTSISKQATGSTQLVDFKGLHGVISQGQNPSNPPLWELQILRMGEWLVNNELQKIRNDLINVDLISPLIFLYRLIETMKSFRRYTRRAGTSRIEARNVFFLFSFLGLGETESTWYVDQYLAYCTSPEW